MDTELCTTDPLGTTRSTSTRSALMDPSRSVKTDQCQKSGSTRVPDGKRSVPMDLVWGGHLNHSAPAKFRDYLVTIYNQDVQEVGLNVLSGSRGALKPDYDHTGNVQGARLLRPTVHGTPRVSTNLTEHLS